MKLIKMDHSTSLKNILCEYGIKITAFLKRNKIIVFAFVLGIATLLYNLVWVNKTFVMSENWSQVYSQLIDQGKVPYRDFYYYLPPFTLFYDYVFLKLSFGYYLIYRLWRLAERILCVELMYFLTIKKVKPYYAFITCFLAIVLFSANVYDLGGDYNQQIQLLSIVICWMFFKYADSIFQDAAKKKYLYIGIVGFIGGLMFLTKQTIFMASVIVFSILFLFFSITKFEKTPLISLIWLFCGAAIPLGITAIYLLANNCFPDFIYQCFVDTGSKGSLYEILLGRLLYIFYENLWLFLGILGLFLVFFLNRFKGSAIAYLRVALSVVSAALLFCFFLYNFEDNLTIVPNSDSVVFLFLIVFAFSILFIFEKTRIFALPLVLIFTSLFFIIRSTVPIDLFTSGRAFFFLLVKVLTGFFFCIFIWLFYHIIVHAKSKNFDYYSLIIASVAIAACYATFMVNGEASVGSQTAILLIPGVAYINNLKPKQKTYNFSVKYFASVASIFAFCVCLSQKLTNPYQWYGDSEASYWDKTERSDIECLKGFRFSKAEKIKYDEMNKVVSYYSDENSTIWGFPYPKVYNLFQNNYNMVGFVPILFYDVCADDYAISDAETLRNNEPDIVVWLDMPGAMEIHEEIYRDGKPLGQRHIQKWFSEVKDTDYTLVGQASNVFIYKLNDGRECDYKYIQNEYAVNKTATYLN